MASKDDIIQGLEVLITESRRLSTSLSEKQWDHVVDLDGWKNKEVLAHIAGVGAIVVPMVSGFSTAPAGVDVMGAVDIDGMNAGIVAARAGASASDLADEVEKNYRGAIDFVRGVPEETLAKRTTAMGHKDIPISDLLIRMVVMHGFGHIYSVYSGIFYSKD